VSCHDQAAYAPPGAHGDAEAAVTAGMAVRAARASVFAAMCVLLAALGHVMMSGTPLPRPALAVAFAVTASGSWAFARRERGPVTVIGAAAAVQGLLHVAFALAQPHEVLQHAAAPRPAHGPHSGVSGMLAAHLLAALLSAVWLGRGERAVFRLLRAAARRLLAPVLPALSARPPAPPAAPAWRATESGRTPRRLLLVRTIPSRGPPAARTAVA
jgi:hypothetical protein